jgi:hypothetical protein
MATIIVALLIFGGVAYVVAWLALHFGPLAIAAQ